MTGTCNLVVVRMMSNDYPKSILPTCDAVEGLRLWGSDAGVISCCQPSLSRE